MRNRARVGPTRALKAPPAGAGRRRPVTPRDRLLAPSSRPLEAATTRWRGRHRNNSRIDRTVAADALVASVQFGCSAAVFSSARGAWSPNRSARSLRLGTPPRGLARSVGARRTTRGPGLTRSEWWLYGRWFESVSQRGGATPGRRGRVRRISSTSAWRVSERGSRAGRAQPRALRGRSGIRCPAAPERMGGAGTKYSTHDGDEA